MEIYLLHTTALRTQYSMLISLWTNGCVMGPFVSEPMVILWRPVVGNSAMFALWGYESVDSCSLLGGRRLVARGRHVPISQKDEGSWIRRIPYPGSWSYIFILPWDPWHLECCHCNMAVGSYGPWISDWKLIAGSRASWILYKHIASDPEDLRSCAVLLALDLSHRGLLCACPSC